MKRAGGPDPNEEPRTDAGRGLLAGLLDYDNLPPDRIGYCRDMIVAIEREAAALDVERLYWAMNLLDQRDPGIFNIVAISEPDTRPVAEALAAEYAAPDNEP